MLVWGMDKNISGFLFLFEKKPQNNKDNLNLTKKKQKKNYIWHKTVWGWMVVQWLSA